MASNYTAEEMTALPEVFSGPRFATYLQATHGDQEKALDLYRWNAEVSAAFIVPLHLCEVAVRNGAVEAIEAVHGPNWPWTRGFVFSLPRLKKGYQPQDDITALSGKLPTSGKIVAELKFAFWQYTFTKGQDSRLWRPHFASSFPGYDMSLTIGEARSLMHADLEAVRRLRNRIAHHEPIFNRALADEYARIRKLLSWRRPHAASWLDKIETITDIIAAKPIP